MKLNRLLVFNALVALVYGLSFALSPATVLSLYGATTSASEMLTGQLFGAALISLGLLTWLARNVTDLRAQRAIILSSLIANTVGVIVAVKGTVSGVISSAGWSAVGIYLVLAMGYGYFQFRARPPQPKA